ncbi:aminopeptidase [Desulfovibrio litoralis]|uniref:M18 family aminopeptidase n=1 Tax=Desulfovibrio litoralis DSM 11393 TaxID=1121455 RepID=A0A1M7TKK5_9BACT|nr:aminopeptidase [Desulfovibrio litoralis]SHN71250.1 aspartyl aminopeptidase [Desulfovibrio litoralis DSM 11393]
MKSLANNPKSAWEIYKTEAEQKSIQELSKKYLTFLSKCKTEREVVNYVKERLNDANFSELSSADNFYLTHHNKTLFAVKKGKLGLEHGVHLIGSHIDSPRLDFKQCPLLEQAQVGQAKTHYYGGIRKYQWLARPLAIHGVVVKTDGTVIDVVLGESEDEPVFTIVDLLPHLASKQNTQSVADAFEAEKLNLVLAHRPLEKLDENAAEADKKEDEQIKDRIKAQILKIFNEKYGITEEDFYSSELEVVPAGSARFVGLDASLIGGYGHDDRICVFASLEAFLSSQEKPTYTQVLMLWDKEEIGSEGSTGAKSAFFEYCMEELIQNTDQKLKLSKVLLKTKAISADVHPAIDPDWQELHEKMNAASLGFGPCFCKFTGHRGKYEANDAHAEYVALMRKIMNENNIPWQMAELGKVDSGGGGTVAMYLAQLGMNIIDFGPPLLSMHSPFELASTVDLYATAKAYAAFYNYDK